MDPFARQVAAYKANVPYYPSRIDAIQGGVMSAGRTTDESLRGFAEAAYTQPKRLKGFTLVPGLSTRETAVYIDESSGQAVITHRGSATAGDAWTDAQLAAGLLRRTPRFKRSQSDVTRAIKALKGYDIVQTGHSLGASLARANADTHGVTRSVGYNTGYSLTGWGRQPQRYSEYLNNTDIVSLGARRNQTDASRYWYSNNRYALGAHRARPTKWHY